MSTTTRTKRTKLLACTKEGITSARPVGSYEIKLARQVGRVRDRYLESVDLRRLELSILSEVIPNRRDKPEVMSVSTGSTNVALVPTQVRCK